MRWTGIFLLMIFALAACGPAVQPLLSEEADSPRGDASSELELGDADSSSKPDTPTIQAVDPASVRINNRLDDPNEYSYSQLIPFDGIRPVYEPQFVGAEEAPLTEDELVIGIALEGQAKAYPITVLRLREMVNDELAGIPILVTW